MTKLEEELSGAIGGAIDKYGLTDLLSVIFTLVSQRENDANARENEPEALHWFRCKRILDDAIHEVLESWKKI